MLAIQAHHNGIVCAKDWAIALPEYLHAQSPLRAHKEEATAHQTGRQWAIYNELGKSNRYIDIGSRKIYITVFCIKIDHKKATTERRPKDILIYLENQNTTVP